MAFQARDLGVRMKWTPFIAGKRGADDYIGDFLLLLFLGLLLFPSKHKRFENGFASTRNAVDGGHEAPPHVVASNICQTMSKLAILATAIVGSSAFAPSNTGGRLVPVRRRPVGGATTTGQVPMSEPRHSRE